MKKLLDKIDDDKEWFPGKQYGEQRGRKRVLTGAKASAVCRSAKAIKTNGGEPTYALLCANAKVAVTNPETGEPVNKHAVYDCLRTHCYDKDPEKKWTNRPRLARKALTPRMIERRFEWSKYMRGLTHSEQWYYLNLVWVDICNSVLPTTEKKAAEQALARKGNRAWGSEDAMGDDANLRGDRRALKMNSWDTVRVWWMPVLTRGKLHVEMLPPDFPGDVPDGAATVVAKVRSSLNVRFQATPPPQVLFTDRGAGFYNPGSGCIAWEFKAALREHGLKAFMRDDASVQPGSLADLMLHETAVAWIRNLERQTLPKRPWEETPDAFAIRLKSVVAQVNRKYKVERLCRQLPERVEQLFKKRGGKLGK